MGLMKLLIFMILAFCITQEASAQALSGCQSKCGNVVIPYPFGIGANCSASSNFTITCNNAYTPPKPLLGNNISNEVVQITISDSESTIRITNPSKQDERPPQFLFADNQTRSTTVLDWSSYWSCNSDTSASSLATCGKNAVCSWNGYCACQSGYEGNPYTPNGCQDINECSKNDLFYNETSGGWYYNRTADSYNETSYYQGYTYCSMGCNNHPGTYSCYCFSGYVLASDGRSCNPDNKRTTIIIGVSSAVGVLILVAVLFGLYKLLTRRIEKKRKEKFFKKNGGLLLKKQMSSSGDASVENSKLFSKKELEMATDYYNENRILGQGGQGTVYKGMLTDGRIVAVKKSKIEQESELEPFINEVVILSKIDQRNIVKLHGYCLETEVPLLVYEFIPNGTLYQYIHEQNEDFPLSWDVRVRVAKEIAGALSYLHSSASIPIYHRDIKSTNILLDEKFRAKVADFGTSRSVKVDQTHLTTRVQGTFGYFDPEYFQSSQFTDKSDVYSFGVVLVELLTGQKPILSHRSDDEERSLATFFILAMEQDRLFDIVDPRVINEGKREEMLVFAKLARRCLHLNGRKRPTMRQVATELEVITVSMTEISDEHYDEVEYSATELIGPWGITSSSVESGTVNSTLLHCTS